MQLTLLPLLLLAAASGPKHHAPKANVPVVAPALPQFHWDIPEPKERVEVPGVVSSNGLPMKLFAVRSGWKTAELVQYFATAFEKAGLYIPPAREQIQRLRYPQLTALDPERMVTYTVILQPNEDGSTTVITGEAHLAERKPISQWLVPLFPGAEQPVQSDLEAMKTLIYTVPAAPADVQRFYDEQLKALGFQAGGGGTFAKGGRVLRLDVRPGEKGGTRVLVMDGLPLDQGLPEGGNAP